MIRSVRLLTALLIAFGSTLATADEGLDPVGDVTFPNADIVAASASVVGGMLDLRLRFASVPFQGAASMSVRWDFDTDQDPTTGDESGVDVSLIVAGHSCRTEMWGIPGVNRSLATLSRGADLPRRDTQKG